MAFFIMIMQSFENISQWYKLIKSYELDESERRDFTRLIKEFWPHINIHIPPSDYTNRSLQRLMNFYLEQVQNTFGESGDFVVAVYIDSEFDIYDLTIGFSTSLHLVQARLEMVIDDNHYTTGGGY